MPGSIFDQMTEAQVLAAAKVVAEEKRSDDFLVRIYRKESVGSHLRGDLFCHLGGVQLNHLAMRETWMPRLIGAGRGGVFEFALWHTSDKLTPVGGPLFYSQPGNEGPPVTAALTEPGWEGPKVLVHPKPLPERPVAEVLRVNQGDGGAAGQVRREVTFGGNVEAATDRAMKAADDLDKRERQIAEERHKLELAALHDKFQRKIEDLESKVAVVRHAPPAQVVEARTDLVDTLLKVGPLVQGFLAEWKTVRLAETASHREQAQSLAQVMRESLTKQAEQFERAQVKSDERIERLFAEIGKNRGGDGAVLKAQTEATGAMASMALSMIHNAKGMLGTNQGEEKNIALDVIEKVMPTVEKFFDTMMTNAEARKLEAQNGQPAADRTVATTAKTPPPPPPRKKPAAPAGPPTSITEMVGMVQRWAPPAEVAAYFYDKAVATPEMDAALNANARDITKTLGALAVQHLKVWYAADPVRASGYLEQVELALNDAGRARGQVTDPNAPPAGEEKEDAAEDVPVVETTAVSEPDKAPRAEA